MRARLVVMLVVLVVAPGCTAGEPAHTGAQPSRQRSSLTPTATSEARPSDPATSPAEPDGSAGASETARTRVRPVPRVQWRRMVNAGMVRPECPIQRRGQLRRVEVNHYDFLGRVRRGHLVVNADVARSVARVFTRLFDAEFPIRRMRSLETYGGDNKASLRDDNTAAFNCRRPEENNAPYMDSPHANGRAIDINPRENPWLDLRCDCWSPGARFAERTAGAGKILRGGVVWRAFRDEGWIWQNIDVPDYMHFDTGYPSTPFPAGGGR